MDSVRSEAPLSQKDIEDWMEGLDGDDHRKITLIKEMLRCRIGDKMSKEDIVICKRCLRVLEDRLQRAKAALGPARL